MPRPRKLWPLLTALAAAYVAVLAAGLLAPYSPRQQNRNFPYAPPMRLHWLEAGGHWRWRPFVYPWIVAAGAVGPPSYQADRAHPLPLRFFVRDREGHWRLFAVAPPAKVFLLGTDGLGRDQFSRLLYGGRVSLLAGLLGAGAALVLALLLGGAAGLRGGWTDDVIMRGGEVFLALPWIYLLFAARAFLPLTLAPATAFLLIIALLGGVGWAQPARLIRGVILSARERDYARAARACGASDFYLLRRHLWPEAGATALTQAALLAPRFMLAEVALSFLGLGVAEPAASWGNMLAQLRGLYVLENCWWLFAPALALVGVVLLYDRLARALAEAPVIGR